MSRQASRVVDQKKLNTELFTLTYGALVAQLVKDYENPDDVNKQLDKMGYNIGLRLVEDFLARTGMKRCNDFRETADAIAKTGFRMFMGVTPQVANWSPAGDEFSLIFDTNPLTEFVELPEEQGSLQYCNILGGVIRGALEMVQMDVSTRFVADHLKGDSCTELRVKFLRKLEEAMPAGED